MMSKVSSPLRRSRGFLAVAVLAAVLVSSVVASPSAAASPATFSGVLRNTSGQPVANADIHLYGPGNSYSYGRTGADGSFGVQAAPGVYSLTVRAYRFGASYEDNFRIDDVPIDLTGGDVVQDITGPLLATVRVLVRDGVGVPASGVVVQANAVPPVVQAPPWPGGPVSQISSTAEPPSCVTDVAGVCSLTTLLGAAASSVTVWVPSGPTFVSPVPAITTDPTDITVQQYATVASQGAVAGNLSIATPGGTVLSGVSNVSVAGNSLPSGAVVVSGALSYTVSEVPVGGTIDVTMTLPPGSAPNALFKLQGGEYVDVSSLGTISGDTVTMHLTDGGVGDEDGVANGVIVDPVVPVRSGVPSAPLSVSAVPGAAAATVTWLPPSQSGGDAITSYTVTPYVGTTALAAQTFPATASSGVITGLTDGTIYTFRVAATNSVGTGPTAASGTVRAGTPGRATGVHATTQDLTATVSWLAPVANGTSAVTSYTVTPYVGTTALTPQTFPATATSGVITGLTHGTNYRFRVAAKNSVGSGPLSAFSNSVTSKLTITPGAGSVVEGDSGQVTIAVPVTLSAVSTTPVTVNYTTLDTGGAGIATAGADYVATSGTVTFAPGQTSKTVSIVVNGDTMREPPLLYGEWILVSFSNPSGAAVDPAFYGLGIGVIVDDDPIPTIKPGVGVVVEGDSGDVTLNVPVTLSNPSAETITVDYATLDTGDPGVATAGIDYTTASGTVTFNPGEITKTVQITVHGDTVKEPPLLFGEWILLVFSNPSATATLDMSFFGLGIGVIIDDD